MLEKEFKSKYLWQLKKCQLEKSDVNEREVEGILKDMRYYIKIIETIGKN